MCDLQEAVAVDSATVGSAARWSEMMTVALGVCEHYSN